MKKLFLLIGIAIIVSGVIWFFLRDTKSVTMVTELAQNLPFGSSAEDINIPTLETGVEEEKGSLGTQNISGESSLFRISNTPTAGYTILSREGGVLIRYVDRGTGHISETILPKAGSATGLATKKITNNTLPEIYEAYFRADGGVLLRFLEGDTDTVKNISLTLTAPKSTSTEALYTVSATNLRGNLGEVMVGPKNFYYVLKDNSSITSSDFTGTNQRTLLASAFNNWRLDKLGDKLLIYTKASATALGYAYSMPIGGGSLTRVLGPLPGLVVKANQNGTKLLYSYSENGINKLFMKNLQTGLTSEILPASLAEKCAWSGKNVNVLYCGTPLSGITGSEPDNWYLGITHFTDYIWRFDTASEVAQLVSQPKDEFGLELDISELKVSPNDDFLIFINKRDQTLWASRLD